MDQVDSVTPRNLLHSDVREAIRDTKLGKLSRKTMLLHDNSHKYTVKFGGKDIGNSELENYE
jgi:hypothetical protein